ncbi:hypothetical protein, partial [Enterococcus sp. OL5]|uniref:hypothetical protein n=1 Tax=Enterococcus sp. OL5 TaxID=2590214 RepID=UPI001CB911CF
LGFAAASAKLIGTLTILKPFEAFFVGTTCTMMAQVSRCWYMRQLVLEPLWVKTFLYIVGLSDDQS